MNEEMLILIKKSKINYYVSGFIILFSFLVIGVAPIFIEDYLWQIMLLPIFIQFPTFLMSRKFLKSHQKL
jgi:hypothetical protein